MNWFRILKIIWTILVATFIIGFSLNTRSEVFKLAKGEAITSFQKDVVLREWATQHGGVYVKADSLTPPNPYLEVPNRDIYTPDSVLMTLMNPAYITRQIHELAFSKINIRGHITSLNPIRPQNAPDAWERRSLMQMEKDTLEIAELTTLEGVKYLRYMGPLFVSQGCLKCHAVQGYKLGDIRGGISASVPWAKFQNSIWRQTSRALIPFILIWIIGMLSLIIIQRQFKNYYDLRDNTQREILAMNSDLSQIKAQLEKSIREKDQLFSVIAHDLRSPFQGLIGLTEVLNEGAKEMETDEIIKMSAVVNKKANHLFNLLQNLLEWVQSQKGATAFEPVEFNMHDLVSRNLDLYASRASEKKITLTNHLPLGLTVFADYKMIDSVIRNLINNAIKFTPVDGNIDISSSISGKMVEITVSDTGIGIPKEILTKLFITGEKTGRKGTAGEGSTGLGLLICKDFIEKNGGIIHVESTIGEGSKFRFTVPKDAAR